MRRFIEWARGEGPTRFATAWLLPTALVVSVVPFSNRDVAGYVGDVLCVWIALAVHDGMRDIARDFGD